MTYYYQYPTGKVIDLVFMEEDATILIELSENQCSAANKAVKSINIHKEIRPEKLMSLKHGKSQGPYIIHPSVIK